MQTMLPNRPAGKIVLPAPTPPDTRVRIRRSQMPAAAVLTGVMAPHRDDLDEAAHAIAQER